MKKFLAVSLLILLPACADLPAGYVPKTPAQAIYQLQGAYATALSVEVRYSKLPRCHKPAAPKVCSDSEIVKKVGKASDVAWDALKAAQGAVRTEGYGSELATTALTTAVAALKAYTDITTTLATE